jgi:phospholipase C
VVNTINKLEQSPFWNSTAIIIAYDDSDGWYDHQMGPIVSPSNVSDDNLTGPASCGVGAGLPSQGRCGYGPRLPLLVISPYAKVNFVDHTVTDQSSILRFVEDNWNLGRIGNGSSDAYAGSLMNMFNFGGTAAAVMLDPSTGKVVASTGGGGGTSGGGGTGAGGGTSGGGGGSQLPAVTKAIANPKSLTVVTNQYQLDGSASTSFDGKALTYQWTIPTGSPAAGISGATTAKPIVNFWSGPSLYTFTLTVTDSAGTTSTDTATIYFQ